MFILFKRNKRRCYNLRHIRICRTCTEHNWEALLVWCKLIETARMCLRICLHLIIIFCLQINSINLTETYACFACWSKIESFHEFYVVVEANYSKHFHHTDVKLFINPLLDCEPETIIDRDAVKQEAHQFDSTDYAAVFVPSTSYWDDSNKQIDSFTDDKNLLATEPSIGNSHAVAAVKEERASIGRAAKRKNESIATTTESTLRQQRRPAKKKLKGMKRKSAYVRRTERKNARHVEEVVCYMCHKPFASFRGNLFERCFFDMILLRECKLSVCRCSKALPCAWSGRKFRIRMRNMR